MSSYTLQIIAYNGSALFELVLSNALTEILSGCQFFFSILCLKSIEIIFTIYNFIYIVLITFTIETN